MPSRRDFFRTAAAVPASWTALATALRGASTGGDGYWNLVKRQFPLDESLLYLNAANVCPASRPVMDRHLEYLRDFHANPSFQNRAKYEGRKETLRGKIARLLRVSPEEVAITRNTSEASNIVATGLDLKPGDEVVVTAHNHPSNLQAWTERGRRQGFTVRTAAVPVPAKSPGQLLDLIAAQVSPRTRVIAVTHVTSTTGVLFPARDIAALARQKGIWMHLDGAQSFGALDVDLAAIGCDSYSASAHKWMMGPLEAGMLFVRQPRIDQLWPSVITAGWEPAPKGARKLEVFGQRDDPRMVAFEAAIDFVNLIGMPRVEARARALAQRAMRGLASLDVEIKTSPDPALSAAVVKFKPRRMATQRAYDTLWEKHRLAIAMTASGDAEGLRFSPHVYNSEDEIDRAVAAVKQTIG